ncbi:inositol polyphosphate 5-phosphatase [Apiotrichum porosum]|uniref:phosphoinositide 5-phosphatase n=1 Tax=Apiotrichum porosum TaxID=105984 RepID=A0A427XCQ8_9TREE|nr:inositol polyphosphate 5-phosphatase [Apiotrichum porosum]RSH76514.1 inositol polyphosphate 5-phosphatase [Apiotrichum porosum]
MCVSYTQVRGSVPLFWQQPQQGLGTLQQKVELTRPPQATQPAFDKHFMGCWSSDAVVGVFDHFGALRSSLKAIAGSAPPDTHPTADDLVYTSYDFHAVVRLGGHDAVRQDLAVMHAVNRSVDKFDITAIDATTGEVVEYQHGVFRTNCLDCLDRTNYVQEVMSTIFPPPLPVRTWSVLLNSPTLWSAHRELWADNGDRLSKTYAGTGALNTSATRTGRKTFAGLLSDATKSVGRAYINNFQDKGKQTAIDMLLGLMAGQRPVILFDPVGDSIHSALVARKSEYSVPRNLVIFSGTWNADIYAIAFQEIVELTPQQIVVTDPAKKRAWEGYIMDTFAQNSAPQEYILMRSEQLVGTALMVVVKSALLPAIRNVEYADKKTGLQGLSGNKGGVGVRFNCFDSTICLMTCHLAAGQSNYADRNADYRTIDNGLHFLRGKTIDSHDIVVWAADFNYRIDLSNEEARELATTDQLDALVSADQLTFARDEGEVFNATPRARSPSARRKYDDNGTDVYDSSEKQRIPSWTDRVLYKGAGVHLRAYSCADLRTSDHRPVYAVLEVTIAEVDEAQKARIADELTRKARSRTGSAKLDARVEQAAQGGVKSLVKEFTSVSLHPTPTPSPRPVPPLVSRDSKPGKPKASSTDATLNALNSAYARLGVPPPLPARNGAASATITTTPASPQQATPYETRRKPPPPRPTDFGKIGLPQDASPEITPVATGDFVLVPSPKRVAAPLLPMRQQSGSSFMSTHSAPPALPARPSLSPTPPLPTAPRPTLPPRKPSRQGTLDMDAPPPSGLWIPAQPDNVKPAVPNRLNKPAPVGATAAATPSASVPAPAPASVPAPAAATTTAPASAKHPPPPSSRSPLARAAASTRRQRRRRRYQACYVVVVDNKHKHNDVIGRHHVDGDVASQAPARPIVPAKPAALSPTSPTATGTGTGTATSPVASAPKLAPKPSGLKGKTLTM